MSTYLALQESLKHSPQHWLITGVAGFIGSHLLETLLKLDQTVTGLDNFSAGHQRNLEEVKALVTPEQSRRFTLIEGDIRDLATCQAASVRADFVLHQAALGSVPRSMLDPIATHEVNVNGFLNMLVAARDHQVKRFVYASSSAVYGDNPDLPKIEENVGRPLSPYAATKVMNEVYAAVFTAAYNFETIGLRYFNVFGPRQDPEGAYAAVIPKWIASLLRKEPVYINGDGETSRDFCYVNNIVQANLLAATTRNPEALNQACNIALGDRTTLAELFSLIKEALRARDPALPDQAPVYRDFRPGDIRHSLADISKARRLLGYTPGERVAEGLEKAMGWYMRQAQAVPAKPVASSSGPVPQ